MNKQSLHLLPDNPTPEQCFNYALNFTEERLSERYEDIIKKEPCNAYCYAKYILKKRFKEAEEYIKKDPCYAYLYARDILEKRWKEAEEYIKKDIIFWNKYKDSFNL